MNALSRAHKCLQRHPEVYGWRCMAVGPNYVVEYRPDIALGEWEVQMKDGTILERREYLDQAIAVVLELDEQVTLPQDLEEIK